MEVTTKRVSLSSNVCEIESESFRFELVPAIVLVGPCHHGMARPQVADRGTASDKEGSCE